MNVSIWKYHLVVSDLQLIEMPLGAKILHVGLQSDQITVWVEVPLGKELVNRAFGIYGTGFVLGLDGCEHVGTVQMPNGLVWHVFDRGEQA